MTDNTFPDGTPADTPTGAADATADITPVGAPGDYPTTSSESFPWSGEPATPVAEPTRPLPPFQAPVAAQPVAPAPARRGALTAGVLVGALLLGGAAGVAGAAWYDAWQSDDASAALASTGSGVRASNAANLPAGSVEKVAATVLPSVVKINVTGNGSAGSGSGIVLTKDGQILTNNHVVDVANNGGAITVSLNDGRTVKAKVIGTDPVTDIAVIKAEGVDDLTPATIGSSEALQVGQAVVAVGSPYGLNATVTTGIVSALNRPVSVASSEQQAPQQGGQNPFGFNFGEEPQQQQQQQQQAQPSGTTYPAIQTDAAINPGNSGGPLVDMNGRVVGINSSIRTAGDSSTGGSIGLGFSIPIDEVLPIVKQITDGQTPTHARLAISVSDVDANTLAQGAQVSDVVAGGAADKAGLKKGDVITKVGDDLIDGSESLVATIRGHRPGEKVTITYIRDGKTQTTEATLGSDEESPKS